MVLGRLGVDLAGEQLRVVDHARERLVELVRGRARELRDERLLLGDRELLLRLHEPLFDSELLTQVGEDPDRGERPAPPVVDHRGAEVDRNAPPVLVRGVEADALEAARPAVLRRADHAHHLLRASRRVEGGDVLLADDLLGGPAVDALGAAVEEQDVALEIGGDDRVDARVDQRLEEVFRLGELGRDLALLGDVTEREEHGALALEERRERAGQHAETAVLVAHPQVHALRVAALADAAPELDHRPAIRCVDQLQQVAASHLVLRHAGDLVGARVGEEQLPVGVHRRETVGRAGEEVRVALERAQPPLGLEAREVHLLRLIAQGLHDARVAQRDRGRVGDDLTELDLALLERAAALRSAQEEHAHRLLLPHDREQRERAEHAVGHAAAHALEHRVGRRVADRQRGAGPQHLEDLGVLVEVDAEVLDLLIVARRDDVADLPALGARREHDRDSVDVHHLGDAADDRVEDVAEVERRRQRLRELEHRLGVALLVRERGDGLEDPQLRADAPRELGLLRGPAHDVVGPRLEERVGLHAVAGDRQDW